MVTGGGAHKYAKIIEEKMGVSVVKVKRPVACMPAVCFNNALLQMEEMKMLVDGINFFIKNNVYEEMFTYNADLKQKTFLTNINDGFFPFLLVNIGSGGEYWGSLFLLQFSLTPVTGSVDSSCGQLRAVRARFWNQRWRWHFLGSLSPLDQGEDVCRGGAAFVCGKQWQCGFTCF
jgi:hypothetical protein